MTNHRSSWLGDFSQPACVFLNPHIFTHSRWIISKCQLHFSCAHPAVRITESHHVCPARCRGTSPESHGVIPACCRGEHLCQLFVHPTFRLAYSHGVRPCRLWFAAQLMFPIVLGKSFFDWLSTAFVSTISHWSRACCMLGIFDWATAWIDCSQAPSYCVNWLFTLLNFVHESSRFSSCSTEHLWDRLVAASDTY